MRKRRKEKEKEEEQRRKIEIEIEENKHIPKEEKGEAFEVRSESFGGGKCLKREKLTRCTRKSAKL